MSIYVKKKERESFEAMLRRFTRMVIMSKVLTQAKENRFRSKSPTRSARRASAIRREKIKQQKQRELY
ncbi:30S ribosomal protein S21 [candidate division Kazan bacterium]|uniref:30S ribosomal protein S21 n=1 Tax=candidate division Kazan bacterium TaxID=2202143 RepID=A0A420ZBQ9_UNCK3|nr:MAG: 30S ribosomal protein S21 [candidate division Kazan bacterium]